MARLTLDENGAKRRFKLNPGKLSIGSGEGATLRLQSPDVAELHAELLFDAGVARLRPRPGVLPPVIGGKPIQAEVVLAHGQTVKFGAALVTVEYEEGEGPKTPRAAAGVARAGAGTSKPNSARATAGRSSGSGGSGGGSASGRGSSGASRARGAASEERSVATRSRVRAKKGAPTWLVVGLLVIGGVLILYLGRGFFASVTTAEFSPIGAEYRFRDYLKDSDTIGAQKVLDEYEGQDLTPEWRAKVEEMKAEMAKRRAVSDYGVIDREASRFYEKRLEGYANTFLAGNATRAKARVFVRRLKFFQETYPTADAAQVTWVGQMLTRYEPIANLADPSTLEDVQWEIKTLTEGNPRRYKEAFEVIDDLISHATGEERDAALRLKAEKEAEQKPFYEEEILGAALYYDKKNYPNKFDPAKSIEILVQLILGLADQELVDDAASRLVKMPESTILEGYKRGRPSDYDELIKNSIVRARAKELGLVD